jgi:poly(A) polymerase
MDKGVLDILYRLKRNGYKAYLVGGSVRDILLGKKPKDFDIATDARPRQIKRLFHRCFLIGRRFRLAHVYITRDRFVEVATFRAEADPERAAEDRFAANNVFGTIEEDAKRRDFTVNALYYNIADFSIVDYTGGLDDISKKVIRSIGDPDRRYQEDPVRMVRAARFCAQLGFNLSRHDHKAAQNCAHLIKGANAHRMLDELYKILKCGSSAQTVRNMLDYGLIGEWLPELLRHGLTESLIKRLEIIDNCRIKGEEFQNNVLLSALFYDLFAEALDNKKSFQDIYNTLRDNFQETISRLHVPRAEWDRMRNTIARQAIFINKGEGKKWNRFEKKFIQNDFFADAYRFFQIMAESESKYSDEIKYWKTKVIHAKERAAHSDEAFRQMRKAPDADNCSDDGSQDRQKKHRRKRRYYPPKKQA